MTQVEIEKLFTFYDRHLASAGAVANFEGTPLDLARWFCEIGPAYAASYRVGKACRMLGFVQGVLVATGRFTHADIKAHNRVDDRSGLDAPAGL